MIPILESHGTSLYHGDWRDLIDVAVQRQPNALVVDAPYSAKTHQGHNNGSKDTDQRIITYPCWDHKEVHFFVQRWSHVVSGWFVSITDDTLAPVWTDALNQAGRYVFSALPYVAPGSRIRMFGDGPSSWTCWIIVARPTTKEFLSWGTLPGAYILPAGMGHKMPVVGGKPPWLMCRLAEDYSRPGDVIVDPCCGAGTTGIGALRTGRRSVLGDKCREHVDIAVEWIKNPNHKAPSQKQVQHSLFGGI